MCGLLGCCAVIDEGGSEMFQRICALVFSAVLLPVFVCFCKLPPVVPEPFSEQVARTDYFVKISSRSGGIRFSIINNKDRAFLFLIVILLPQSMKTFMM